jgi:hypothetical protein
MKVALRSVLILAAFAIIAFSGCEPTSGTGSLGAVREFSASKGDYDDHIALTWSAISETDLNGGRLDRYRVEYQDASDNWVGIGYTSELSYDVALSATFLYATPYEFRVVAEIVDANGKIKEVPSASDTGFALSYTKLQFYTTPANALAHPTGSGWYKVDLQKGMTYHFTGVADAAGTLQLYSVDDLILSETLPSLPAGSPYEVTWACTASGLSFLEVIDPGATFSFAAYYTF